MIKFVGLHHHSGYSIGDALSMPMEHYKYVIENGGDALTISDHGNANSYGAIHQAQRDFKKKGQNFKCLYGQELYIHPSLDEWQKLKSLKEAGDEGVETFIENEVESKGKHYDPIKRRHHLVIVAKNKEGLKNINRLTSESYIRGFYRFPRVDFAMLEKHKEGLIISSACLAGLGSYVVLREQENGSTAIQRALDEEFKPLLDIFGKENAYVEIQFNKLPEQRIVNDELIKFSIRNGFYLVATADGHYPRPELWRERELYKLLARQTKGYNIDKDDLPKTVDELKCVLHPKSGDEMYEEYKKMYSDVSNPNLDKLILEAIERTYTIAHEQIEDLEPDTSIKLPQFVAKGKDPFETLKNLAIEGLKNKGLSKNQVYLERLAYELKVIKDKNFSLYFLTLKEAMDKIREKMLTGSGRGSGAGSLLNYLLDITLIDPIKNGLIFERFISPARNEYPDIDSDIENKEECLKILKEYFGEENVIPITNFNGLQLKSLIKDISKFYEIPFQEVNEVTTKMENEARQPILDEIGGDQKFYVFDFEGASKYSPTFRSFIEKYPLVGEHISNLFKQFKSLSVHAGGVLICENAKDNMPLIKTKYGLQTAFSEGLNFKHLEPLGFIKFDFLGIATIRIIRKCIEIILREQKIEPTIQNVWKFYNEYLHPDVINPADEKIFNTVYRAGRFPGIFQFAENNVRNFCIRANPACVDDISVITSIWRPGALKANADKKYVEIVHGEKEEIYEHPILKEVLGESKSILAYQEQFLTLSHKLAGFTLEEADQLRKLLVKPVTSMAEEMKQKRIEVGQKFIQGCIDSGLSKERAEYLWFEEILGSISYSFNKSHSISYSYLSYQCAYLFTYYEKAWVRAYLEADEDRDKAIKDVESIGYKIQNPDLNYSSDIWQIQPNTKNLIPSFTTMKGFGDTAMQEFLQIRESVGGAFSDLDSLFFTTELKTYKKKPSKVVNKWRYSKFNKRCLDAMIKVEGFNSFDIIGPDKLFANYRHMHYVLIEHYDKLKRGNFDYKALAQATHLEYNKQDWSAEEKIAFKQEILGSFDKNLLFTQDVLDMFAEFDITPISEVNESIQNHWFVLLGWQKKTSKNNRPYFKLEISDTEGKSFKLNYFGILDESDLKKNALYVAKVHTKDAWLNIPFGERLHKLEV